MPSEAEFELNRSSHFNSALPWNIVAPVCDYYSHEESSLFQTMSNHACVQVTGACPDYINLDANVALLIMNMKVAASIQQSSLLKCCRKLNV